MNSLSRRRFAALAAGALCSLGVPSLFARSALAEVADPANEVGPAAARPDALLPARPSTHGKLGVQGARLVDAQGQPVQLKGFSTHGLAWFPQYVNQDCFSELSGWGANLARLALYTHENGGYCTDGDQASLKDLIAQGVHYATEADMYVIIDWHVLQDCDPNLYREQALAFWDEISATYADRPNVIYEICNEPNGDVGWSQVKSYAEEVLEVIRRNDPETVVLIGTPTWSQHPDQAAADPIVDFDNLMYTLHFYAATHKDDLRAVLRSCVEGGTPVFVSEYGICDASGNGAIDEESANAWIALMDELGVSCACWSLCNKAESASFINPDCSKTSGFNEADLAASGSWFQEMLSGWLDAGGTSQANTSGATASGEAGQPSSAPGESSQPVSSDSPAGDASVRVSLRQSWESDGKTCKLFDISIVNSSDGEISPWSVSLEFSTEFEFQQGWNGAFTPAGATLGIVPESYNASLPAGGSLSDIGFIVAGTADLSVVNSSLN